MPKQARRSVNFQTRWDQGAGQGVGAAYTPWLAVRDVPSKGRSHRIRGWTTNRVHHFLSDLEKRYFLLLDWSLIVTDIREQYPLWPVETTSDIAQQINVKPATIPTTSQPSVVTTDFLITVSVQGREELHARTVKYSKDLQEKRTVEKLEIERLWWQARGVDWGIVTEHEIPTVVAENINKMHPNFTLDGHSKSAQHSHEYTRYLTTAVTGSSDALSKVTSSCDALFNLPVGSFLTLAKHLIATRQWLIDMTQEFKPTNRLEIISFNPRE